MVSRAALLWHLAVGPSVRPSVVLAQPEPEEEEEEEAVTASAVFMVAALYRGRVILASPGALIARPHEQQATNSVTAARPAPKVVG